MISYQYGCITCSINNFMELQELHQVCTEMGLRSNIDLNEPYWWKEYAVRQRQTLTTSFMGMTKHYPGPSCPQWDFPMINYFVDGIDAPIITCIIDSFKLDSSFNIHFEYKSILAYPFIVMSEETDGHKKISLTSTLDPNDPCISLNYDFIKEWELFDEFTISSKHQRHHIDITKNLNNLKTELSEKIYDVDLFRKYLHSVVNNVNKAKQKLNLERFRDATDGRK